LSEDFYTKKQLYCGEDSLTLRANSRQRFAIILVIADDEELRDGIEALLQSDGYRVYAAKKEIDAIDTATRHQPDLILVSLNQTVDAVTAAASRIRTGAGLSASVPVVMFCIVTLAQGEEMLIGQNVYATRLDNFDQLRKLLTRLLHSSAMP
jgi:CheY-like chemotaxis protein